MQTDDATPSTSAAPLARMADDDERPRGVTVTRDGAHLVVKRRWRTWRAFVWLALTLTWDAFIVPALVVTSPPLAFIIAFGGTSLVFTTYAFARLLNTSTLEVGQGLLTARHGPVPWARSRDVELAAVTRVDVTRHARHGSGMTHVTYDVVASRRVGHAVTLMSGIDDEDVARHIARVVDEHIGVFEGTRDESPRA